MSAIVIPFKPRADGAAAAVAPVTGTAQILEFPSRPYSLTVGDVAALEALAPTLDGIWTCEILVNDDGDRWAAFEGHHAPLLMFFVGRSGHRLLLYDIEGQPVVIYDDVDELMTTLGGAIGRRRAASV
jgi:hypothetical protein